jgi:hypothetical protein
MQGHGHHEDPSALNLLGGLVGRSQEEAKIEHHDQLDYIQTEQQPQKEVHGLKNGVRALQEPSVHVGQACAQVAICLV